MRSVGTKIPEDVYEKLFAKAKELGYSSISSLLRDLIYRFLDLESEAKKVNLVRIDYNLDGLLERIKHIEERLAKLEELEKRVERLESMVANVEKRLTKVEGLNRWLTGSKHTRKH